MKKWFGEDLPAWAAKWDATVSDFMTSGAVSIADVSIYYFFTFYFDNVEGSASIPPPAFRLSPSAFRLPPSAFRPPPSALGLPWVPCALARPNFPIAVAKRTAIPTSPTAERRRR